MFPSWMLPPRSTFLESRCHAIRSLKPHEEALGRPSIQHSQLSTVLKSCQPRNRHMSEDTFHWFQTLATWLFLPVWVEGRHWPLLHCTAFEFVTHGIHENDKIDAILCHYVYGGLLKRADNKNTIFFWSNLEFYLWVIIDYFLKHITSIEIFFEFLI